MPELPEKLCPACGRRFAWRKKWARDWENVRYCSDACRRSPGDATDARLEAIILELLRTRSGDKTICPSEAARAASPDDWRPLMEKARRAGRRLAGRGVVEFTQGGKVIDPATARGPVRIRLTR